MVCDNEKVARFFASTTFLMILVWAATRPYECSRSTRTAAADPVLQSRFEFETLFYLNNIADND